MILFIFLLMLLISHSSSATGNAIVPVPSPPNTTFPNTTTETLKLNNPSPDPQKLASKKDYLESLFDRVDVAKTTPPDIASNKLYDKLSKDSVAYGILKEFPDLKVGSLAFRPLSRNTTHKQQILDGQNMILREFSSPNPLTYKNVTDTINQKIVDPNSAIKDIDWILMSNAFRTLQAPGAFHKAHLLGDFIAEYILLSEIKKQENKPNINTDDRSFLSALYYDLSQLYQSMYKNDENLFTHSNPGRLNLPLAPAYRGEGSPTLYDQGYGIPFDTLAGQQLDLLGNSLLFDPYDDLAWASTLANFPGTLVSFKVKQRFDQLGMTNLGV